MNLANYANSDAPHKPSAGAWFLFVLAPILGSALAALVFRGTRGNEFEVLPEPLEEMGSVDPAQKTAVPHPEITV